MEHGSSKGSVLEESEMSHLRAYNMREKTRPNTGKGFRRVSHSCSSRQARGIKIRIRASLGSEGKSVLLLPIREQGKLL